MPDNEAESLRRVKFACGELQKLFDVKRKDLVYAVSLLLVAFENGLPWADMAANFTVDTKSLPPPTSQITRPIPISKLSTLPIARQPPKQAVGEHRRVAHRKLVTKTEQHIRRAVEYLLDHPGQRPQPEICRTCRIPEGSTMQVFRDARFVKANGGDISLAEHVLRERAAKLLKKGYKPAYEHQSEIVDLLRKRQPMKAVEVATALQVSYVAAKRELESGAFHLDTEGWWLPLTVDGERLPRKRRES